MSSSDPIGDPIPNIQPGYAQLNSSNMQPFYSRPFYQNQNPYVYPGQTQPHCPNQNPSATGGLYFGIDPNPAFTNAINRLAAALEKLNERNGK